MTNILSFIVLPLLLLRLEITGLPSSRLGKKASHRVATWAKVFDYCKVRLVKRLPVTFVRETDGTTEADKPVRTFRF